MTDPLPIRLSRDRRAATWNPALTRAGQVLVRVVSAGGDVEQRRSMNSGRVKVREGERIESVTPTQ
jgi:hypothetical protein